MRFAMFRFVVLCFGLAATNLLASPAPASVRTEVQALMTALQTSGCEFNRNGKWHSGAEAAGHLMRKFEHMEGKNLITTTERFIEQGASASSSSGKAYSVRCASAAPVDSNPWLMQRLEALRKKGG